MRFSFTGQLGVSLEFGDDETDDSAGLTGGGAPFKVVSPGFGNTALTAGLGANYDLTKSLLVGAGAQIGLDTDTDSDTGTSFNLNFRQKWHGHAAHDSPSPAKGTRPHARRRRLFRGLPAHRLARRALRRHCAGICGFDAANRIFDGKLESLLGDLQAEVWRDPA